MTVNNQHNDIIFFDGVCNLCNSSVSFIHRFDGKRRFKFSPLSGKTSKNLHIKSITKNVDSIVYLASSDVHVKSDAVIEILKTLFPAAALFITPLSLIPKSIRDYGYDLVAKNRLKFFGASETCRIPTEEEKEAFLP
jgi:predicted DCC family thiol-disulfide oxidoreductase YuxK